MRNSFALDGNRDLKIVVLTVCAPMWVTLVALCCIAAGSCLGGIAQTRFTLAFFKHEFKPHENAVLAPIGIQSLLTMLYHVAKPRAAQFMQKPLFLPTTAAEATEAMKDIWGGINQHKTTLEMLSRVYLPDEPLNPDFVPHLRNNFNVSYEIVNLNEEEKVAEQVNLWAYESTRGMIPQFVTGSDLYPLKSMLLVNVIFLNASWGFFDEEDTKKQMFHFVNGDQLVDMMQTEGSIPHTYLPDLMVDVVKLPYQDGTDLSMLIILPAYNADVLRIVHHFTTDHYEKLAELDHEDECYESIQLSMPRFTIQQKLDARSTLSQMQVGPLFSHLAFKILEKELSQLGRIKQSIFVKVNENGTNAGVGAGRRTEKVPASEQIYVDRPFLFMIRKESAKEIVIIGHYSKFEK